MIKKVRSNLKSGFTVALVSVPLSISLAIASHVSPVQGIITGIWAGLIASLFGGSNFNVIGVTGALSGIIASFVFAHGIAAASMLAIVTGIIILIAYALRFERYIVFIPSSVIHGFTLGVALIIGLNQINFACGLQGLPTHEAFIHNIWQSLTHLPQTSFATLATFLIFLTALQLMRKKFPLLPGVVMCSPVGIALGYFAADYLHLETLYSRFGEINVTLFQLPSLSFSPQLIWSGLTVALIAIIETMLSAKIADNMTKTKHREHKEMLGLGLANIASGLCGGIPATAALARTALNVKSGATNKISATLSSIFIAVIAVILLPFFKFIPMAVIAAILVMVAINMVETEHFGRLFAHDKVNFFLSLLVAGITVYKDPIIGILVGASVSLLLFVEKLSRGYYDLSVQHADKSHEQIKPGNLKKLAHGDDVLIYTFKGKLSYINSHAHVVRFETNFQEYQNIILCLREVYFIDIDGIDTLDEIIEIAHKRNELVLLAGVSPFVRSLLKTISRHYCVLEAQGLVLEDTAQALDYLNNQTKKSS